MRSDPPIVVFCHLDGTEFDPYTCGVDSATRAAQWFAHEGIPLVLFSHRTRKELELIQHQLGVEHPFICESGGAVLVPDGYFTFHLPDAQQAAGYRMVEFGMPHAVVTGRLHRAARRLGIDIVGFSEMSVEEVATACGLSLLQASLAKLRTYDEPFRIIDVTTESRSRLSKALAASRLTCIPAGTYEHAGGADHRGAGAELLLALYHHAYGPIPTVGIGDGVTDIALLDRVDVPLIIRRGDWAVTGRPTEIGWSTVKEEARWAKAIRQVVRGGSRSRDSDGLSWPRVYQ